MSSIDNEVVTPQTPVIETTNVDEMKTNAKKVMEQAVAASQKRSLDNASEDSNSLAENPSEEDPTLAKNGSRTKKLRVENDDNNEESLDQAEDNVEDEDNDEEDIDDEEDMLDGEDDDYGLEGDNGSLPEEQELGDEDDTNGVEEDGADDE